MSYYQKNKEKLKTKNKERYEEHKDEMRAKALQYYYDNVKGDHDKLLQTREYNRLYYQKHKHNWNARVTNRPGVKKEKEIIVPKIKPQPYVAPSFLLFSNLF